MLYQLGVPYWCGQGRRWRSRRGGRPRRGAVYGAARFIILPELAHPAVVCDLPGHKVGGHRVGIGGPPTQGVDQGHGHEMFLAAGVNNADGFRVGQLLVNQMV